MFHLSFHSYFGFHLAASSSSQTSSDCGLGFGMFPLWCVLIDWGPYSAAEYPVLGTRTASQLTSYHFLSASVLHCLDVTASQYYSENI